MAELFSGRINVAHFLRNFINGVDEAFFGNQLSESCNEYLDQASRSFPLKSKVSFATGRGLVEWTGFRRKDSSYRLVVIRLEEDVPGSTDGVFENQKIGTPPGRFLMLSEESMSLVPNFSDGDFCYVCDAIPGVSTRPFQIGGFVRSRAGFHYTLTPIQSLTKPPLVVSAELLLKAPPPVTEEMSDRTPPISLAHLDHFVGRNRGIQGKNNSCYLDTLLFSLFAFSDTVLADLEALEKDESASEAFHTMLGTLRYDIVFPLRAWGFVSDSRIEFLREILARESGDEKFKSETRDIPECLTALFERIFGWTPGLEIGDVTQEETIFFKSGTVELLPCDSIPVPTSTQLLEFGSISTSFCLAKVPKLLMLQLPRNFTQSSEMVPSLSIDLDPFLFESVKVCCSCSRNATLQFPHRFDSAGLAGTFLCKACAEKLGLSPDDGRSVPESRVPDGNEPDSKMLLSAVICIERSHYNCFVRCGNGTPSDRWVFFDSMSDQEDLLDPLTHQEVRCNIPLVAEVPDLPNFLEKAETLARTQDNLESLFQSLEEPSRNFARRLLKFPYLAIYTPCNFDE